MDAEGYVTAMWADNSTDSIYTNRYIPAGCETINWIGPAALETSDVPISFTQTATDNDGCTVVVYQQGNSLYARYFDPATNLWGPQVALNGSESSPLLFKLAIDWDSGNAIVTWVDYGTNQIYANRAIWDSNTSSFTWQGAQLIATPPSGVEIADLTSAIGKGDETAVLWREVGATSTTLRIARACYGAWQTPEVVTESNGLIDMANVVVTYQGKTHVIWRSDEGAGFRVNLRTYDGEEWCDAQQIDAGVGDVSQIRVDTDPYGDCNVAWVDGYDLWMNWDSEGEWNTATVQATSPGTIDTLVLSSTILNTTLLTWTTTDGNIYASSWNSDVDLVGTGTSVLSISGDINENGEIVVAWTDDKTVYARRFLDGNWLDVQTLETSEEGPRSGWLPLSATTLTDPTRTTKRWRSGSGTITAEVATSTSAGRQSAFLRAICRTTPSRKETPGLRSHKSCTAPPHRPPLCRARSETRIS